MLRTKFGQTGLAALLLLGPACGLVIAADGEAAVQPNGRTLVQQNCGTCHTLRKGEKASEGPNLYGIVGRKAGTAPGFRYSPAFSKALRGKVWTPQLLDRWLADTEKVAPNSAMVFFSDNAKQRKAMIDYLTMP